VERDPTKDFPTEEFLPAVSITVDPEDAKRVKRGKLYVEDATANIGFDAYGSVLSNTYITLTDQYGDRRLWVVFSSVDLFSNFQAGYRNLNKRLQWGVTAYDNRSFYLTGYDYGRDQFAGREEAYRVTGATFDVVYPLSKYYRLEGNVGGFQRAASLPVLGPDNELFYNSFKQNAPVISGGIVGDTVLWARYGPHQGSRFDLRLTYAHDIDFGGVLTQQVVADYRKYFALGKRSEFAIRVWGGFADGNNPTIFAVGGTDTVRGYPVRSIAGNQAAFANFEWRFPLIDRMDLSFMSLGGIRGRLFMDVGYSCYTVRGQEFDYRGIEGCQFMGTKEITDPSTGDRITVGEDGRLLDGVAAYGFGISLNLFGLPFHWDWIKLWDFKESRSGTETNFWIGWQF